MDKDMSGWMMKQTWENLLFLHWQVPVEELRAKLPAQLELDTYEGKAWVGIVPFSMNHIRVRGLPEIPFARSFLECNVRKYVKYKGEPGVYFFSLDANHAPAVAGARRFFSLPYFNADMKMEVSNGTVKYSTRRVHKGTNGESLKIEYTPGERIHTVKGSLTEWLTERYCLWTIKNNRVYKGAIQHKPWELYEAHSFIKEQSLWPQPKEEETEVHQCYSPSLTAYIWPLSR
ncbi:YqjF family protein [Rossellomorea vietnamensis]|uniref:YqjF family protein n=1 Tax=Rossellomorea vietnamensis TaxID=218284 RepID=UPI003CE81F11